MTWIKFEPEAQITPYPNDKHSMSQLRHPEVCRPQIETCDSIASPPQTRFNVSEMHSLVANGQSTDVFQYNSWWSQEPGLSQEVPDTGIQLSSAGCASSPTQTRPALAGRAADEECAFAFWNMLVKLLNNVPPIIDPFRKHHRTSIVEPISG